MTALRLLPLLAGLTAAVAPLRPAGAEPPRAKWWNDEWKFRKVVRITFPRQGSDLPASFFEPSPLLGRRFLTGKIVIDIEGQERVRSGEVVVTDANGKEVLARAYASGWNNRATVLFQALPATADYYIYYGNPKANVESKRWRRSAYPMLMVTLPVDDADAIATPARAARAVLAADPKKAIGNIGTYSINAPANPFGLKDGVHYITLYSGLVYAPATGTYGFAIDARGKAHLLIDSSLVHTARGGPKRPGTWTDRAEVKLIQGIHTFTVLHGERYDAQGIRIGWRPPGERRIALMSGSAFARGNYTPAEVVGFDVQGKETTPFFTVKPSEVAFELSRDRVLVPLTLQNWTEGRGLTCHWQVGGMRLSGRSPRCFVNIGGSEPDRKTREEPRVVLEVFKGDEALGEYVRTVKLGELERVRVDVKTELLTCPGIFYEDEPAKATFGVSNISKHPVPLEYQWVVPVKTLSVPPRGGRQITLELTTPTADDPPTDVTLRLWHKDDKAAEATVRISNRRGQPTAMLARLGHAVAEGGPRIVLGVQPEDVHFEARRTTVRFRLLNPRNDPIRLRCEGLLAAGSDTLDLLAKSEETVHVEIPTPRSSGPLAQVGLRLWNKTTRLAQATVRLVHRDGDLAPLLTRLGHRVGGSGPQAAIITRPEDVVHIQDVVCRGTEPRIHFRLTNPAEDDVAVRYEWEAQSAESISQTLSLPPGETPLRLELPSPGEDAGRTEGTLTLWSGDVRMGQATVRLDRRDDAGFAGSITRTGRPVDAEGPRIAIRINPKHVVPNSKRTRLTFRLVNRSAHPASLRYEWLIPTRRFTSGPIEAEAGARKPIDVELPVPSMDDGPGRGTFRVRLAQILLHDTTLRVARPNRRLYRMTSRLGRLVDRSGLRVALAVRPEDPAEHRRWALIKWIKSRLEDPPKRVLLFGDPMANPGSESETTSYVGLLKSQLEQAGRTFRFQKNQRDAVVPCLADIPALAKALNDGAPDLLLISPGSRSALKGVTQQRFARSLDVLIDIARAQPAPPKVVLVSPPPLVSNLKLSRALAETTRLIARQHHLPCVDLHSVITAKSDWKNCYKHGAKDEVYYLYPNPDTHKELAEAILAVIQ